MTKGIALAVLGITLMMVMSVHFVKKCKKTSQNMVTLFDDSDEWTFRKNSVINVGQ